MSYQTPLDQLFEDGIYEVEFPATTVLNGIPYKISGWEDGRINPTRTVELDQDKNINVNYVEVKELTELIISGTVTNQVAEGEEVTITITKPDLSEELITALTNSLKEYSATKEIIVAGVYKFKASVSPDAGYEGAESGTAEYTINLAARSITINVVAA